MKRPAPFPILQHNMLNAHPKAEFDVDGITIDAAMLSQAFGTDASTVRAWLRGGELTSYCEHGVGVDASRYRLTFFHGNRRFRLVIADDGTILQRSMINLGDRASSRSLRHR